ncbi:transposase [Bacillus salipaludis]|uniref:transposase n=1 Tax=Bacillus salipaludis TaxID=2547811 RepID=UPI003AF32178
MLASQTSLSSFFRRFDNTSIKQLEKANQELLDKVHTFRNSKSLIFDLDSTHSDTYGHEESATYSAQYGNVGFP